MPKSNGEAASQAGAEINPAQEPLTAENPEMAMPTPEEMAKVEREAREFFAELAQNMETLAQEKNELEVKLARLSADFTNYKRRTEREKAETELLTKAEILTGLLPALDNFDRAVQAFGADAGTNPQLAGIKMIFGQLTGILTGLGLETIPALGEDFDPNWHEAIGQEAVAPDQKGKVIEVMQTGYKIQEKLLRPSMVRVGN